MTVIAHLSDIHVDGDDRSVERTERVVRYIAELPTPVDVVLVTGDVADHGAEAEYEQVRELVKLPVPTLFCPGNHDRRAPFSRILLAEESDGTPVNRAYRVGGALFAMCDSSVPGRDDGLLTGETLDWLDAELSAAAGMPAFVCFHHPPAILGVPYADRIRQFSVERLSTVVTRHLDTCTGGPTVKSHGGWDVTWFVDYDSYHYKSRLVVELYECGGGLVKKTDTGVVEKSGEIRHETRIDTSGYSGRHYTRTKLVSLHLRLDGVVWTNTSSPVVTSACTTI